MARKTATEKWVSVLAERELLPLDVVARELRVSRSTVYELMARGELEYVPVGGHRRVKLGVLKEYIDRLSQRDTSGRRKS